jgi:hypothetical protein
VLIKKCPKAHAPLDANGTPEDSVLEDIINQLNLGVIRSTRALIIATAGAIIKGLRNLLKIEEFPDRAGNSSSIISKLWPVNEVTAVSNCRSCKPSLSKGRGIQIEIMERKFVKEVGCIKVPRDRALSDSGVFRDRDVQLISSPKKIINLGRDTKSRTPGMREKEKTFSGRVSTKTHWQQHFQFHEQAEQTHR